MNTKFIRGGDIIRIIIDERRLLSLDAEALQGQLENPRVGLHYVFNARNHHVLHEVEDRIDRPHQGEGLHRPVGQAKDTETLILQLLDVFLHARNLSAHHLHELAVIQLNLLFPLGMLGDEFRNTFRNGFPIVVLGIPLVGANVREEPLGLVLVAEIRVIEVMRVPVEEHAAVVEYEVFDHHFSFLTSGLRDFETVLRQAQEPCLVVTCLLYFAAKLVKNYKKTVFLRFKT